MSKEANKPAAAVPKETGTWSMVQLLVFTMFGAMIATFASSIFPPSPTSTPLVVPDVPKFDTPVTPYRDYDPNIIDASKVKILSFDPLIMHITDFVSESERKHLLEVGVPLLTPSAIQDDSGAKIFSPGRTSSTAFLPETDEIVKAVALRAATFQGFLNPSDVEMQITSYNPGQEYKHHYDWYPAERGRNRVSTFFAILRSTCDKCGTEFPFFNVSSRAQYSSSWCDIIDCTSPTLTSLNIEGSAIFWANLDLNRKGRKDMLHAGLPALGGEKVGLNVWADVDIKEIEGRGMFGGWSRMWYRPTREFLKSHGLVKPEEAEGVYKG